MKKFLLSAAIVATLAFVSSVRASTMESASGGNVHASFDITIAPDGSITTTSTGFGPFDGVEDTGFDVLNHSASPVGSLTLTAPVGNAIDGFDSDGIAAFVATGNTTDTSGYAGPGSNTFSNDHIAGGNTVITINFGPAIPAGNADLPGSSYFSLEGPANINLTVTAGTPLPASSLMGAAGILGLALLKKLAPKMA